MQTIIWTALPNGVEKTGTERAGSEKVGLAGPHLRLSVLVSPRLQSTSTARVQLSNYPDFLNWPTLLKTMKFTVQFEGKAPLTLAPVTTELDDTLWTAIFSATTPVDPYQVPAIVDKVIESFPVSNILQRVKEAYQAVGAASPVVLPRTSLATAGLLPMQQLMRDLAPPAPRRVEVKRALTTSLASSRARVNPRYLAATSLASHAEMKPLAPAAVIAGETSLAERDWGQFQGYYNGVAGHRRPLPTPAALVASLDFHHIVANLQQHPLLMRKLGLIVDLEIPLTEALMGARWVQVSPVGTPDATQPTAAPRTMMVLKADEFVAASQGDGDLSDGLLRLDDADKFEIGEVDVDGTALKLTAMAQQVTAHPAFLASSAALLRTAGARAAAAVVTAPAAPSALASDQDSGAPLPSVRSAGLWVARVNRAADLAASFAKVAVYNKAVEEKKSDQVVLYAEDLVRGYRVDVWDETVKQWFSVCARVGTFKFAGLGKTLTGTDEGWVTNAAVDAADEPNKVYVHETVFRWEGWSLAAPRPGQPVPDDSGVGPGPGNSFGVAISYVAAPGSLPRLRFGREYRLRARVVDLAGNSLSLAEAGDTAASAPFTYFRAEPILPPVVLPRTLLGDSTPGESVDNLVIRTANTAPAQDSVPVTITSQRHLLPPRTSELMAETHGEFDGPTTMKDDAATYQLIVSKDVAPADHYDVDELPLPYLPDPLGYGIMVRLRQQPSSGAPPSATTPPPLLRGPVLSAAQLAMIRPPAGGLREEIPLVRAGGFSAGRTSHILIPRINPIFLEPQDQMLQIPFGEDWPHLQPVRLVLYEPTGENAKMEFEAAGRVLRVPLPKGEAADMWVSCYLKPVALQHMTMWRWTVEGMAAPAVRQANLPAADALQVHRQLHDLTALPAWSARVALPAATVTAIKTLGDQTTQGRNWLTTPFKQLTLTHATQQPLGLPWFQHLAAPRNFGQTFAELADDVIVSGKSSIKLEVHASWNETIDPLAQPGPQVLKGQARVGEVHLERDDATIPLEGMPHAFGDTKYRHVTYEAVATSRYAEYFLPPAPAAPARGAAVRTPISAGGRPLPVFTRISQPRDVDVLSSARPLAPKILYVIPVFAWNGQKKGETIVSTRQGGWLRVYLERPWFSSGDGELLGVVLGPDTWGPYVTQWGLDPLVVGPTLPAAPVRGNFKAAKETETGLSLAESSSARVEVAGHVVVYDPVRQLWYADIEVDCGDAYFPFLRLALARYQPHSLKTEAEDCKLSRVMLADFAQLAPDRAVTLTFDSTKPLAVGVTVAGPIYSANSGGREPSTMIVTVDERTLSGDAVTGWTPVPDYEMMLRRTTVSGGIASAPVLAWIGQVTLPTPRTAKKYRLVIREYETYLADPTTMPTAPVMMLPSTELAKRVVYMDVLDI